MPGTWEIMEEKKEDDDINIHEAACESFYVHLMMLNVTPLSLQHIFSPNITLSYLE